MPTHRVLVINTVASIATGALAAVSTGPLASAGAAMLTTTSAVHALLHMAQALTSARVAGV